MILKKVQEGCKIRRTYGIFGYTRRDKLFTFVSVGVFYPLSRRPFFLAGGPNRPEWSRRNERRRESSEYAFRGPEQAPSSVGRWDRGALPSEAMQ
jgi:hypothetical protein